MQDILKLGDFSRREADLFGDKAARLSELVSMNLPIPLGFCVSHSILDMVTEDSKNYEEDRNVALRTNLTKILQPWYDKLMKEIADGPQLLVVRSSAIGEDSSTASFAGQFESILGVSGVTQLSETVLVCRNSVRSKRVLEYVQQRQLPFPKMSVIVQQLIMATSSGVCFSCHPVTLDKNIYVIESNWGFGDTVVGGMVTPDHFQIDIISRSVTKLRTARKKKMSIFVSGRLEYVQTQKALQRRASLRDEQLWTIVDTTIAVQRLFKEEVDVEWVWGKQGFFVVQCRPITILKRQ